MGQLFVTEFFYGYIVFAGKLHLGCQPPRFVLAYNTGRVHRRTCFSESFKRLSDLGNFCKYPLFNDWVKIIFANERFYHINDLFEVVKNRFGEILLVRANAIAVLVRPTIFRTYL